MRKKYRWSLIWLLYVGFIFHNSMTPAAESSAQSMSVLRLARQAMDVIGLSGVDVTEHIIRKMAHFGEYTVLGMLLIPCLSGYGLPRREHIQFHVLLGFVVPFADETIQLFTQGRSGQISDVWLDCSGVAFGTLVLLGIRYLWRRKMRVKKRKEKQFEEKL